MNQWKIITNGILTLNNLIFYINYLINILIVLLTIII